MDNSQESCDQSYKNIKTKDNKINKHKKKMSREIRLKKTKSSVMSKQRKNLH